MGIHTACLSLGQSVHHGCFSSLHFIMLPTPSCTGAPQGQLPETIANKKYYNILTGLHGISREYIDLRGFIYRIAVKALQITLLLSPFCHYF